MRRITHFKLQHRSYEGMPFIILGCDMLSVSYTSGMMKQKKSAESKLQLNSQKYEFC